MMSTPDDLDGIRDEIIFNVGPGGIQAGSLTARELSLLVREDLLPRVKFVTGLTY